MARLTRFVYLIVGIRDDEANGEGCSRCISDFGCVFTSKRKAIANLEAILHEVEDEAQREDYNYTSRWNDDHTYLEIEFGTGSVETYSIYKVKLN
jgi:hypothetical protein